MKIKDISLRGKLIGGFLLVILIFTSGSAVSLYNMMVLQETEHEMAKRSTDADTLMRMEQLFSGLYPVIADSVINRNFKDARNNFSQQIIALEESLSGIEELADTGQEQAVARNIVERTVRFRNLYLTEMLPRLEKSETVARRSQDSISILKMELLLANAYTYIADAIINGEAAEAREVLNELLKDVNVFDSQLRDMADTEAERMLARELETHMSNYLEYALNTIIPEIETGAGAARLRILDEEADRLRLTATEDLSTMSASLAGETLQALADEEAVRSFDEEIDTLRTEIFSDYLYLVESLSAERHEAEEAFDSRMVSTRRLMTIITLFALVAGLLLGLILANAIVRAMKDGIGFAAAIARGDLKTELAIDQRDEIGKLADSLRTMQKELQYKAGIIASFAQGDLSVEVNTASEVDGLGASLREMRASLNEVLGQVARSVYQVNSGSDQVAQASQTLSQGAAEQASSLEEISSSLTELNGQAQENAKKSSTANTIVDTVALKAGEGAVEMQGLHEAMQQINSSSEEITKVVKIIDDLAFQINLLALNANVEAARAGKYGRGFAVVAEEVRNLASRSAEAVKGTTSMVENSSRAIANGNNAVGRTSEGLKQIVSGIDEVTVLLQEISSASREQALGIDQITIAVDQIGEVVQSNTASAEESAAASEELASQAKYLESMIGQFTLAEDSQRRLIGPGAQGYTLDV